ncbi:MAG: TolB family protein [Nocardioides sp.]
MAEVRAPRVRTARPSSPLRLALSAVVVAAIAGATAYGLDGWQHPPAGGTRAAAAPVSAQGAGRIAGAVADRSVIEAASRIVFRHTGLDARYGQVAEVALAEPAGPRAFTGVDCDRVYARPGVATCLRTQTGVSTSYQADDLVTTPGTDWRQTVSVPLPGIPSRTRLSPDGTLAASTVFVTGDSYMTTGFSARTIIRHVGSTSADDLEKFLIVMHGRQVRPRDRNIWGVTFAPDDRTFYVTLATGGRTYLARGDLAARTITTIADHVECPSLSPDGTRIAFKQARTDRARGSWWTPAVLDLATGRRTVLTAETHTVDDQIEWLDDHTLLYGLARENQGGVDDVWALNAAGHGAPRVLIPDAWSPAVIR